MSASEPTTRVTSRQERSGPISETPESAATSRSGIPPSELAAISLDSFNRASDRVNPILVKEIRQAVKSRAFVATFLLMLLGAWLVSVIGLIMAGPSIEYGTAGLQFFNFYLMILGFAVFVIVPFVAYRSLLNERDENTYELLSITTLSPGQIVRGKWSSALVQMILFYSALAPFMAFTSLLQGFDFAYAAYSLVVTFYLSACLSMAALMSSTIMRGGIWQGLISLALLVGLVILFISMLSGIASTSFFGPIGFDSFEFWWAHGMLLVGSLSYLWLFYQIAAARLTFESENRSTGIRVTASAQFFLLCLGVVLFHIFSGEPVDDEESAVVAVLAGVHWAVLGLVFCGEPDRLSHRVRRSLPHSALKRFLLAPFLPGGSRGYLYLLFHIVLMWGFCAVLWSLQGTAILTPTDFSGRFASLIGFDSGSWSEEGVTAPFAIGCYVLIYCGLVTAIQRWGHAAVASFQGLHARAIVVILLPIGALVPIVVRMMSTQNYYAQNSLADIFFPFWLIGECLMGSSDPMQHLAVFIGTIAVVGMNASAMIQQVRAVRTADPSRRERAHVFDHKPPAVPAEMAGTTV